MTGFLRNAVLGAVLVCATAVAGLAQVAGQYFAYGRNPDGSAYTGTVQIVPNGDNTYTVNWQVGTNYSGQGSVQGNVLVVDWGDTDPAVYVIMSDGDLHGTWADGTGLELLTREPR